ncbi:MAG TPA: hypothetical protein VFS13_00430 [Steroidobacteraceae bacterium]|nr:hypothetical protein [Steroidobacteraceae bacterium]
MTGPSWPRAIFAWMFIMLAETLHGAVREIFIAPVIGSLRARQIGVLVGSLMVLAIAWLTVRWMRAEGRRAQFAIGGLWVALTLAFEALLGRAMGLSWERLLEDYNPAHGGFMILGLAIMFIAPWLAGRGAG